MLSFSSLNCPLKVAAKLMTIPLGALFRRSLLVVQVNRLVAPLKIKRFICMTKRNLQLLTGTNFNRLRQVNLEQRNIASLSDFSCHFSLP